MCTDRPVHVLPRYGSRRVFAIILAVTGWCACSSGPASPVEERVRSLVDEAEELAEAGDAQGFGRLLSDDYRDERGNSKQSAILLLTHYLSSHRSIHLLTRTAQVNLADSTNAEMLVFVAMAGRPIAGIEELGSMRADLYHFVVGAREEDGEWRIRRTRWGRGWDVEGLEPETAEDLFRR